MHAPSLLVEIAEREVGVREEGGSNRGARIVEYQRATWLEPGAWPWCQALVAWCIREWIERPEVRQYLGLKTPAAAERWRPKSPSAFGMEEWARDHGQLVLPESEPARAGDVAVFDFSHVGIVVQDETEPGLILTVEGNTDVAGGREGEGVWKNRRAKRLVRTLIRWKQAD